MRARDSHLSIHLRLSTARAHRRNGVLLGEATQMYGTMADAGGQTVENPAIIRNTLHPGTSYTYSWVLAEMDGVTSASGHNFHATEYEFDGY